MQNHAQDIERLPSCGHPRKCIQEPLLDVMEAKARNKFQGLGLCSLAGRLHLHTYLWGSQFWGPHERLGSPWLVFIKVYKEVLLF